MTSKLYGVNATIIVFVFVLYCIVLYSNCKKLLLDDEMTSVIRKLEHFIEEVYRFKRRCINNKR